MRLFKRRESKKDDNRQYYDATVIIVANEKSKHFEHLEWELEDPIVEEIAEKGHQNITFEGLAVKLDCHMLPVDAKDHQITEMKSVIEESVGNERRLIILAWNDVSDYRLPEKEEYDKLHEEKKFADLPNKDILNKQLDVCIQLHEFAVENCGLNADRGMLVYYNVDNLQPWDSFIGMAITENFGGNFKNSHRSKPTAKKIIKSMADVIVTDLFCKNTFIASELELMKDKIDFDSHDELEKLKAFAYDELLYNPSNKASRAELIAYVHDRYPELKLLSHKYFAEIISNEVDTNELLKDDEEDRIENKIKDLRGKKSNKTHDDKVMALVELLYNIRGDDNVEDQIQKLREKYPKADTKPKFGKSEVHDIFADIEVRAQQKNKYDQS